MPTRDNFSNQVVREAIPLTTIGVGDIVTKGSIIDTADYSMGIRFAFNIRTFNGGTHVLSFEEGNDPALSDAVAVGPEKIIGDAVVLTAIPVQTEPWPGNGLVGTKRYVRAVVSSFDVTGPGTSRIYVTALLSGEYNPQDQ